MELLSVGLWGSTYTVLWDGGDSNCGRGGFRCPAVGGYSGAMIV